MPNVLIKMRQGCGGMIRGIPLLLSSFGSVTDFWLRTIVNFSFGFGFLLEMVIAFDKDMDKVSIIIRP